MSISTLHAASVQQVLERPTGIVHVVDALLQLCRSSRLQLDLRPEQYTITSLNSQSQEIIDGLLRPSVFRAMLARLAAICNEQGPRSVSPYGGRAVLLLPGDPNGKFDIAFSNTADEQWLRLKPL